TAAAAHLARVTPRGRYLFVLSLAALGVVYGDIGTSPLYALRECFHGPHSIVPSPANILGVLSMIFWSLVIVISVKYLVFVLNADNHGEGGILSLTALAAVEGLTVAAPLFSHYVVPITIVIIVALFLFQSHGTARIGRVFGPV